MMLTTTTTAVAVGAQVAAGVPRTSAVFLEPRGRSWSGSTRSQVMAGNTTGAPRMAAAAATRPPTRRPRKKTPWLLQPRVSCRPLSRTPSS
jgi:hypothetical protein